VITKLNETFKKLTTKIFPRVRLPQLPKRLSLWNVFDKICLKMKAFFWPIQLGRDKQFFT